MKTQEEMWSAEIEALDCSIDGLQYQIRKLESANRWHMWFSAGLFGLIVARYVA